MKFVIDEGISHNDIQTMTQVFFPLTGFDVVEKIPEEGHCLVVKHYNDGFLARIFVDTITINTTKTQNSHHHAAWAVFDALSDYTGYHPPWGVLTGIRPAKLITSMLDKGISKNEAINRMTKHYLVCHPKAELCANVALAQQKIMQTSKSDAISIYINIPFCPTKCHYCSFAAYPISKFGNRIPAYMDALCKEIKHLGKISRNKYIENIYIGGGTPTALSVTDFGRLLACIDENFNTKSSAEYTVEAGRPDTICIEKLNLMRKHGVNRISINPQTLHDTTLQKIGRKHTANDFFDKYKLAQQFGFTHINIDLILGLEGETVDHVHQTLEGIGTLDPNSITVHALAIKRASKLWEDSAMQMTSIQTMEKMLAATSNFMQKNNLIPYYLYRQKNSLGNFENVGYSKADFEGRYNIHMMEETRSVYAAGCGAVTKIVDLQSNKIDRIFNIKDLDQYIKGVNEMIAKKAVLEYV